MTQIILASQSAQRKSMMDTLGISYEIIPADIDEKRIVAQDLAERAQKIALAKAEEIEKLHPEAIIIAADTYGDLHGQALEKPADKKEAAEMLRAQSGNWVKGYTGFAYLDGKMQKKHHEVFVFEYKFRSLSDSEIQYYVSHNPVTTWAAGIAPAYDEGLALLETMKGSLTAFSHGLPMERVASFLKESNVLQ